MSVKVETSMTIQVALTVEDEVGKGSTVTYVWSLDEARAIKDELIRMVGAQNPSGYAPVLRPVGGFVNKPNPDHVMANGQKIPEHLLKRAEAAREKAASTRCYCGDVGWGENGCCGVSGCNNVPG